MTLALRLIHIIAGVFWAGAVFFLVLFLAPAVREVGPDGGKVMVKLNDARFFEVMPLMALLTILSGVWLMWIMSGGFDVAFFATRWGIALTIGGVAAIAAFIIGVALMRPATTRLLELGPQVATAASDAERQKLGAEMQALQKRSRTASIWVAWLLLIAVAAMAGASFL